MREKDGDHDGELKTKEKTEGNGQEVRRGNICAKLQLVSCEHVGLITQIHKYITANTNQSGECTDF